MSAKNFGERKNVGKNGEWKREELSIYFLFIDKNDEKSIRKIIKESENDKMRSEILLIEDMCKIKDR